VVWTSIVRIQWTVLRIHLAISQDGWVVIAIVGISNRATLLRSYIQLFFGKVSVLHDVFYFRSYHQ